MAIAFDSVGTGGDDNADGTITWTHTVVSNSNGIILAALGNNAGGGSATSIKFAGTALTRIVGGTSGPGGMAADLWYLLNPPTGLGTFNGTVAGIPSGKEAVSMAFTGVNQTTPIIGSAIGSSNVASSGSVVTTTLGDGNWWVGGFFLKNEPGTINIGNERGTSSLGILLETMGADSTGGTLRLTTAIGINHFRFAAELGTAAAAGGAAFVGYKTLLGVGG